LKKEKKKTGAKGAAKRQNRGFSTRVFSLWKGPESLELKGGGEKRQKTKESEGVTPLRPPVPGETSKKAPLF